MLELLFKYFEEILEESIFKGKRYDELNHREKLNLVGRMVFALRNGILNVEKPLFKSLIYKIAIDNDKKVSKLLAKQILYINIDSEFLRSLAINNLDIAEEFLERSNSLSDAEIINISKSRPEELTLVRSIAKRKNLTEFLTDYVVSRKDLWSIKRILMNHDSSISIGTYVEILQNYGEDHAMYDLFCHRVLKNKLLLNQILVDTNDKLREKLYTTWIGNNKDKILYVTTRKGIYSFDYIIHPELAKMLAGVVDSYYSKRGLGEIVIMKYLTSGDVYSFAYAISKNSEVSYKVIKEIVTTEFHSPYFEEMLTQAGMSHDMVIASRDMLKILYESCLEEYVDSTNFCSLLKKRFASKDKNFEISKAIAFLISLTE
jgi:hypothetical protein